MTISLPKDAVAVLAGRHPAQQISYNIAAAYWLHGRDNDTALFLWNNVHTDFAQLADALGYTIARKEVAQSDGVAA